MTDAKLDELINKHAVLVVVTADYDERDRARQAIQNHVEKEIKEAIRHAIEFTKKEYGR